MRAWIIGVAALLAWAVALALYLGHGDVRRHRAAVRERARLDRERSTQAAQEADRAAAAAQEAEDARDAGDAATARQRAEEVRLLAETLRVRERHALTEPGRHALETHAAVAALARRRADAVLAGLTGAPPA